jgi:CO/xanthine dehydrogenase FAD-binding subunit
MKTTESIDVRFPKNLKEALRLQADEATRGKLLAGGTDLMVQWAAGVPVPTRATSLWDLPELCTICIEGDLVEIGAGVTHAFLLDAKPIHRDLPALIAAAATVGAAQIQARGTLGGNAANASPAGDTAPALLVSGGSVRLASLAGERQVPLDQFWTGYRQIDLRPDEIIRSFLLPKRGKAQERFRKIGTRNAQAISKVMAASRILLREGRIESAAIALGSVAPTPVRLREVEDFLRGKTLSPRLVAQAEKLAQQTVHPIDDVRSTADYRRWTAGRLVRDALQALRPQPPTPSRRG